MENPTKVNPTTTTLLDLNIYVLDEIFNLLGIGDGLNLAKAHPYLTFAFVYYFRSRVKTLNVEFYKKEDLSFLVKNCGEYIEHMTLYLLSSYDDMLAEYCPNVKSVFLSEDMQYATESNIYRLEQLTILPIEKLYMCSLKVGRIIDMLRNCRTLRVLKMYETGDISLGSIRTILNILDDNGVTPEEPFTFIVHKNKTSITDKLLAEISKCDKSNLLKIEREDHFNADDSDSESEFDFNDPFWSNYDL